MSIDVSTLLYQNIYIDFYIINSKTRSNRKVILSFIIELLSLDITSIEIDTDTYYIYLQFLIFNINIDISILFLEVGKIFVCLETNSTNNATLWKSFNNCDSIKLESYYAVTKAKSIARKL